MLKDAFLFRSLNGRRRRLGMTYGALAKRSSVSLPTVVRILSGHHRHASFANVTAVAAALGFDLTLKATTPVDELRKRQALLKAKGLIAMLQGTSSLDGQALDDETRMRMIRQTAHELLSGSPRRLWSE
jgi:hypothetical protein